VSRAYVALSRAYVRVSRPSVMLSPTYVGLSRPYVGQGFSPADKVRDVLRPFSARTRSRPGRLQPPVASLPAEARS
jgi:hypothetical protein